MDERDATVTQLYEVVDDELRALLVVGRHRVERLAVTVMAHDHERDSHGYLFEFGDGHQRGHQHEAVHMMVDHRLDNRLLREHLKTTRRDEQLIRPRADHAGDTVDDEAEKRILNVRHDYTDRKRAPRIPRAGPRGR